MATLSEGGTVAVDPIEVEKLTHVYPTSRTRKSPRVALSEISLTVGRGEIFCLLGPNGSGKSTLFKILATLLKPADGGRGWSRVFGFDVVTEAKEVRRHIGVVFQNPSLDRKLTAWENLLHQGHLYGLSGDALHSRITEMLARFDISDRADSIVEHLSGGLQRRVELAKGLLHRPRLLLLDEPSSGIDPGARLEFAEYLQGLKQKEGVTILLTTHILDEAERSDRIAILDEGNIVALGSPRDLKREIGGDVISVTAKDPTTVADLIRTTFGADPQIIDGTIRFERSNGHEFIPELVKTFPDLIETVVLSKPTLEDVFIHRTGHKFWNSGDVPSNQAHSTLS